MRRHPDSGTNGVGTPADPAEADPPQTDPGQPPEDKPGAPVDFGALLKDKAFQAELGRYVNKALGTARANWEQETKERVKQARTEGEKLASLTAEERAKAEAEERVADILAREGKMAEREAEIMRRELRAAALDTLEQRGLPSGLADVLIYTGAEECQTSIEAVEKAFRQAIQRGVDERLKPKETPKAGGNEAAATIAAMRAAAGLPPKTRE